MVYLPADIVVVGQSSFLRLHFRVVGSTVAQAQQESVGRSQLSVTCEYVDDGMTLGDAGSVHGGAETALGGAGSALDDGANYLGGAASYFGGVASYFGGVESDQAGSASVRHTAHVARLFQCRRILMVDGMLVGSLGLSADASVIAHTAAAEGNGRGYGGRGYGGRYRYHDFDIVLPAFGPL